MKEVAILVVYIGKIPDWYSYFLESCDRNNQYSWIIFSDTIVETSDFKNIQFNYLSINKFHELVEQKTGVKVSFKDSYKICDFKPLYGTIFQDYLIGYNYWGYSDVDIIYGDISAYLKPILQSNPDVISFYNGFMSGPLSIYKNSIKTNSIYKEISDYKSKLNQPYCLGLDEHIIKKSNKGFSIKKIYLVASFFLKNFKRIILFKMAFNEFKYEFQWFFKSNLLSSDNLVDLTEVILYKSKKKEIKSCFVPLIRSDAEFKRCKIRNWNITWENGRLINETDKEIFAFHFRELKNQKDFVIHPYAKGFKRFEITQNGINT